MYSHTSATILPAMSLPSKDHQLAAQQDRIVVILGPLGAGKSTFIEYATRRCGQIVDHNLQSCSTNIQTFRTTHPTGGYPVVLVDTPGFDDECRSVTEILSVVANWLAKSYSEKFELAAVIYLHRISDNRMSGSVLRNLQILASLCSQQARPDVIIATTMWSDVREDTGARREEELKREFWTEMLANGCRTERFEDTHDSAWRIIGSLAETIKPQVAVSPGDHLVLVMGPTGSGKSTFIAAASGQGHAAIRHGLRTATSDIRIIKTTHPKNGSSVVFVDTPGFDATYQSDTETLYQITYWLAKTFKQEANPTSIIYLHQISDNRTAEPLQRRLQHFAISCGQKAIPNVTIATTMWSEVREETGLEREAGLTKDMLASGCKIERFEDTYDSAWNIVGTNSDTSLLLQHSMMTTIFDVAVKEGLPKWLTDFLRRTIRRNYIRRK